MSQPRQHCRDCIRRHPAAKEWERKHGTCPGLLPARPLMAAIRACVKQLQEDAGEVFTERVRLNCQHTVAQAERVLKRYGASAKGTNREVP